MWDHHSVCRKVKAEVPNQSKIMGFFGKRQLESQVTPEYRKMLKAGQLAFVAKGKHSLNSVECSGLVKLLQAAVDTAAVLGKFDVSSALYGRTAVTQALDKASNEAREGFKETLIEPVKENSVAIITDLWSEKFTRAAYMGVRAVWVNKGFEIQHTLLALKHFEEMSHTAVNIAAALEPIFQEYGLSQETVPVVTDCGSNFVAVLSKELRFDCGAHRLHTTLKTAWDETVQACEAAKEYEDGISQLCATVKRSTGIQEKLPCRLKFGGNTRP